MPNPNPRAHRSGLATVQNGSIDVDAERRVLPVMRWVPHRVNAGAAFQVSCYFVDAAPDLIEGTTEHFVTTEYIKNISKFSLVPRQRREENIIS